jgi:hypothetical protein
LEVKPIIEGLPGIEFDKFVEEIGDVELLEGRMEESLGAIKKEEGVTVSLKKR